MHNLHNTWSIITCSTGWYADRISPACPRLRHLIYPERSESSSLYPSSTAFMLAVLLYPFPDSSNTEKQIPKFPQSIVSSLHRLFHAKQPVPLAGQLKVWALRIPVGYGRCCGALPQTLQAEGRETDFHTTALTFPQITFQIIQLPVKSCDVFQEERYLQLPQCRCPTARYRTAVLHNRTQENPVTVNPPWRIIKSGFIFLGKQWFPKMPRKVSNPVAVRKARGFPDADQISVLHLPTSLPVEADFLPRGGQFILSAALLQCGGCAC